MSYIVNFSDKDNKSPITVYDNTSSVDTSLIFPGRNVTGYGQTIAENFLHLLENFASETKPTNPVEGQLWYDSIAEHLLVNDGSGPNGWKAASGVRKGPSTPSVSESNVGELWIDTTNQQLKMFTGARWLLVGPNVSTIEGLLNGPIVEQIVDTENNTQNIIIFYIANAPVIIFSKTTFAPKMEILGFPFIYPGVNINSPAATELTGEFDGVEPKIRGIASSAESLRIAGADVSSNKFMRIDTSNTTEYGLNIRHNEGLTIGTDGTLRILNSAASSRIYNALSGGTIDLQVNRNSLPDTILRIDDNRVGINNLSPTEALDVNGNIISSGKLTINNTNMSTNLSNGSLVVAGGIAIAGNMMLGEDLTMSGGTIDACHIVPSANETYNLGSSSLRWNNISAKSITADTFHGNFVGTIDGVVTTAVKLETASTFKLKGDIESNTISFDGIGSANEFTTSLTSNIIVGKNEPTPNMSEKSDQLLIYRTEASASTPAGLYKQSRDVFIGDMGVPLGTIMPYAGVNIPQGYLLCDGSEVEQDMYEDLYNIIQSVYNGTSPLVGVNTFRLPDLRGRFALGRDNMDNNTMIPASAGGILDSGGGAANRIGDTRASTLGGAAGASTVTLDTKNMPDHTHDMKTQDGVQFAAVRVDSAIYSPAVSGLGPTSAGQAQYLKNSGTITKPTPATTFSDPVGIVNPFLTINYIIRSGPPATV